jgi:hypothetical protein
MPIKAGSPEFEKLFKRNKKGHNPKPTTNQLTKDIIAFLSLCGFHAWRNNTTGVWDAKKKVFRKHHGRLGVSDILGIQKQTGRFIAVEVKTGKDKLSPDQVLFIDDIIKAGGIAIVAHTFDGFLEQFKAIVNE